MAKKTEMVRVVISGDESVGKTSLLMQFLQNKFEEESEPTKGIEALEHEVGHSWFWGRPRSSLRRSGVRVRQTPPQNPRHGILPCFGVNCALQAPCGKGTKRWQFIDTGGGSKYMTICESYYSSA